MGNSRSQHTAFCTDFLLVVSRLTYRTIFVHDERKSSRKGFLKVAAKLVRIERKTDMRFGAAFKWLLEASHEGNLPNRADISLKC